MLPSMMTEKKSMVMGNLLGARLPPMMTKKKMGNLLGAGLFHQV